MVEIPAGQPDARDADLADLAMWQRAVGIVAVQDDRGVGGQRDSDGRRLAGLQLGPGWW